MKRNSASVVDAPPLPNYIASNLKLLRNREGWSQAELARRVNLNRGNIASYECGTAEPSICKLLRISNLFGVHPRDITRRDLANPNTLRLVTEAHDARLAAEKSQLEAMKTRANVLQELVNSSRKLFDYKREKLTAPCPETAIFAAQYQQLYEVTQQLLEEHRQLLKRVGCDCE